MSTLQAILLATLIVALLIIGALWFLRTVWFRRDPVRTPASTNSLDIISPCDGMVVYARPFKDGKIVSEKLGEQIPITEILHNGPQTGDGWMLGIYLSPLDVHFSYSPQNATVQQVHHKQAAYNLPMIDMWEYVRIVWMRKLVQLFGRRFHLENERCTITLTSERANLALVLIADKFVSKIQMFAAAGEQVNCGGKLAFIGRGSQIDVVIFDSRAEILVKPGERVVGGEQIIARLEYEDTNV